MALRIWCNPKYFPVEIQGVAVETAMAVLAHFRVTFEQVREAQAHIDQVLDDPQRDDDAEDLLYHDVEDAWFAAIAAAEERVGIERTPIGSMLVLDEADWRFAQAASGAPLQ